MLRKHVGNGVVGGRGGGAQLGASWAGTKKGATAACTAAVRCAVRCRRRPRHVVLLLRLLHLLQWWRQLVLRLLVLVVLVQVGLLQLVLVGLLVCLRHWDAVLLRRRRCLVLVQAQMEAGACAGACAGIGHADVGRRKQRLEKGASVLGRRRLLLLHLLRRLLVLVVLVQGQLGRCLRLKGPVVQQRRLLGTCSRLRLMLGGQLLQEPGGGCQAPCHVLLLLLVLVLRLRLLQAEIGRQGRRHRCRR